jgi:hypothetical protein
MASVPVSYAKTSTRTTRPRRGRDWAPSCSPTSSPAHLGPEGFPGPLEPGGPVAGGLGYSVGPRRNGNTALRRLDRRDPGRPDNAGRHPRADLPQVEHLEDEFAGAFFQSNSRAARGAEVPAGGCSRAGAGPLRRLAGTSPLLLGPRRFTLALSLRGPMALAGPCSASASRRGGSMAACSCERASTGYPSSFVRGTPLILQLFVPLTTAYSAVGRPPPPLPRRSSALGLNFAAYESRDLPGRPGGRCPACQLEAARTLGLRRNG